MHSLCFLLILVLCGGLTTACFAALSAVVQRLTDGPGLTLGYFFFPMRSVTHHSNIPQKCLQHPKSLALLLIPQSTAVQGAHVYN